MADSPLLLKLFTCLSWQSVLKPVRDELFVDISELTLDIPVGWVKFAFRIGIS
jgi:hypothetical protein